jgi:ADP-heptose:LPS heptosyltransferase
MPARLMAKLSAVRGVDLHVLQSRTAAAEWPSGVGKLLCPEPVTELAHAIANVDLVITIDSLPAHLGGALGVPTWTLLSRHADWRWMEDRSDSPWYPSMRLWRQPREGDWESVIDAVAAELAMRAKFPGREKQQVARSPRHS